MPRYRSRSHCQTTTKTTNAYANAGRCASTQQAQHAAVLLTTPFLAPLPGHLPSLPPLLIAAEATPSEEASNACVLLSRCRGSRGRQGDTRRVQAKVFGEVIEMQPGPDPYQPLGASDGTRTCRSARVATYDST